MNVKLKYVRRMNENFDDHAGGFWENAAAGNAVSRRDLAEKEPSAGKEPPPAGAGGGSFQDTILIGIKQIYFPIGIPEASFSRSSSVRESKNSSTLPVHISISGFTEMKVQT